MNIYTSLFNLCFKTGIVPSEWNVGILHPILKDSTKDLRDHNNYRGLMICSHMSKLYSGIINSRISIWVTENEVLNDEQNGFVKGRSCQDHLQSFLSIIETRKIQGLNTKISRMKMLDMYMPCTSKQVACGMPVLELQNAVVTQIRVTIVLSMLHSLITGLS